MKLTPFLNFLNQLQVLHWQTEFYAQHVALGDAYKQFQKLFDKFIEVYYGKYSVPSQDYVYSTRVNSYKRVDVISMIRFTFEVVLEEINNSLTEKDSELQNIKDEIEAEFGQLLYLLNLR